MGWLLVMARMVPYIEGFDMRTRSSVGGRDVAAPTRDINCDAPFPGGPLTTRQPAEYMWMSGYPTPPQKIEQSLLCTGSSTQLQNLHILSQTNPIYAIYIQYIQSHE